MIKFLFKSMTACLLLFTNHADDVDKSLENWVVHEPHEDPFAAAVGEKVLYQVHIRKLKGRGQKVLDYGLSLMNKRVAEYSKRYVDSEYKDIYYIWDSVYSSLTVSFINKKGESESLDIFKILFVDIDSDIYVIEDEEKFELETAIIRGYLKKAFESHKDSLIKNLDTSFKLTLIVRDESE